MFLTNEHIIKFESIIILLLWVLKVVCFYSLLGLDYYMVLVIISSLMMTMGILYFLFKQNKLIFFLVYLLLSIIMFVDLIYYQYFNQLPSIVNLHQIFMLKNVNNSVFELISFKSIVVLLDLLPVYFLAHISVKIQKNKTSRLKGFIGLQVAIICFLIIVFPIKNEVLTSIKHQEFISYHFNDIINTCSSKNQQVSRNIHSRVLNQDEQKLYEKALGIHKNLIVIQVESLQNFVINKNYNNQEITPHLNELINDNSIYFKNYYQQLGRGNTSDAEFVSMNSFYPVLYAPSYVAFSGNDFFGLPFLLKERGYEINYFHGYKGDFWSRNKAVYEQGFENFYSEKDYKLDDLEGLGLSDKSFFNQSADKLKKLKTPFFNFYVTLTSHHPYKMKKSNISFNLKQDDQDTLFGRYIQAIHYTDEAIGQFILRLKDEGYWDNTVVAIYGDHHGLNCQDKEVSSRMGDFIGHDYYYDEMLKVPLIIHIPNMNETKVVDVTGSQLDFLPTIGYILGIGKEEIVGFGQNLLTANEGVANFITYMLSGSYINDANVFQVSRDGVYNHSKYIDINTREALPVEESRGQYEKTLKDINDSKYILEHNLIGKLRKDSIEQLRKQEEKVSQPEIIVHAGGRIEGISYTNSKEAIENAVQKGHHYIELDFSWTKDNVPVLLHDWQNLDLFEEESGERTLEEFKAFKMKKGLTQWDIFDLANYLRNHRDIYIVTDVKERNVEFFTYIMSNFPDLQEQFIPQIYEMKEYNTIMYLGYPKIIYTLYLSKNTKAEIIDFCKTHDLFAVTMPVRWAEENLAQALRLYNIFTYCHTINQDELLKKVYELGVNGIYTDDYEITVPLPNKN